MLCSAVVSLALAASALGSVFLTSPVASTTFTGGQQATVSWQESGNAPTLAQFGNATFAIYVGNAIEQTPLQTIATSVNVSSTSSFTFTPQPDIGPNSGQYFIRVTSGSYMDGQYNAEAFSALFTLTGMTGTFNSTEQAEINGQSTAPIGGTSTASAATKTATGTGTSTATGTSKSASSTAAATTTGSTSSTTSGAGKPVIATGFVALVAALVGASFL
jgi:hypothetical protein